MTAQPMDPGGGSMWSPDPPFGIRLPIRSIAP